MEGLVDLGVKYKLEKKNVPFGKGIDLYFENGYGASIISGEMAYTNSDDEFELAVLKRNEAGGFSLCYETEITDDVIGNLSFDELKKVLVRIVNLKATGE